MITQIPDWKNKTWGELNTYKSQLKLNSEQHDILVGTILGDLYMQQIGKSSRLVFEQKNKEYLYHLYEQFQTWTRTPPKERKQQRLSSSEIKSTWYFSTLSHPEIQNYRVKFYTNGKKTIPSTISDCLTPRSLAYWFMDDGTYNQGYYSLATCSFTLDEQKILLDALATKFNLVAKSYGKNHQNIYFPASNNSNILFRNIIEPYLVPSMLYKLGP